MISLKLFWCLVASLLLHIPCTEMCCWKKVPARSYKRLLKTSISTYSNCRTHCFDISASSGLCSVFDFAKNGKCRIQTNGPNTNELLLTYTSGSNSYILKPECKGDGCWSEADVGNANLKTVPAKDETECKFICLETEHCRRIVYQNGVCSIQIKRKIISKIGKRLSALCKKETCWKRVEGKSIQPGTSMRTTDHFACRKECLERTDCTIYTYVPAKNFLVNCYIETENDKDTKLNDKANSVTYLMKDTCLGAK